MALGWIASVATSLCPSGNVRLGRVPCSSVTVATSLCPSGNNPSPEATTAGEPSCNFTMPKRKLNGIRWTDRITKQVATSLCPSGNYTLRACSKSLQKLQLHYAQAETGYARRDGNGVLSRCNFTMPKRKLLRGIRSPRGRISLQLHYAQAETSQIVRIEPSGRVATSLCPSGNVAKQA